MPLAFQISNTFAKLILRHIVQHNWSYRSSTAKTPFHNVGRSISIPERCCKPLCDGYYAYGNLKRGTVVTATLLSRDRSQIEAGVMATWYDHKARDPAVAFCMRLHMGSDDDWSCLGLCYECHAVHDLKLCFSSVFQNLFS
jgi:hypothetical protein